MNEKGSPGVFYGYTIVIACFLFQGVGIGSYIAFGVFFKPLLTEFGWSRATVSGAASLAFLLMGALGIVVGILNDRFGPRMLMVVTGLFYSTGYCLLSRVHSVWELYLFFGLVVGIGLSSIDIIALTTTARWFVRRRGAMTGFVKVLRFYSALTSLRGRPLKTLLRRVNPHVQRIHTTFAFYCRSVPGLLVLQDHLET